MMRSHKDALHNELQLRYREFFESKLAVDLLTNNYITEAVKQVSNVIVKLIQANEEIILKIIQDKPKIKDEMSAPYFGSYFAKEDKTSPQDVLKAFYTILTNPNPDLSQALQVHSIFVYRLYDAIEKRDEKIKLAKKLFSLSYLDDENRKRVAKEKGVEFKLTGQLGITRHSVFSKKIGQLKKLHLRTVDRVEEDKSKQTLYVAGASGHTRSLLIGAQLYGNLNAETFNDYTLACYAFLAAGGHHSYNEVMVVAQKFQENLDPNQYSSAFSEKMKQSDLYMQYCKEFPEFLGEAITEKRTLSV